MPALLQLVPPTLATTPGAEVEAHVFVGNTGTSTAHFAVYLEGDAAGWAEVEPADVTVEPGHEQEVRLVFRLPRGAPGGVGDVPYVVVARDVETGRMESVEGVLEVQGEAEVAARLVPRVGKGSRTASFKLVVDNAGATPARAMVTALPSDGLRVDVEPDSVIVEPGESNAVRVTVHPEEQFMTGTARSHSFEVRVEPLGGATVHAGGVMSQRPLLIDYLPKVVMALLVIAIIAVATLIVREGDDDGDTGSVAAGSGGSSTVVGPPRTTPTLAETTTTLAAEATTTTAPVPPPPPVPLDERRVAFQTLRDGNSEIYVSAPNGSGAVNVSRHPGHDSEPAWSPDGRRLAFDSDRGGGGFDVFVMNPDGSGVVQLTNTPGPDGYPAWSPDGSHIAFVSFRDGNSELYIMRSDGSEQRRLTRNLSDDGHPTWSSDGFSIAYHSNRSGNLDVWVIGADGKGDRNITNAPGTDANPDWSPDGKRIAFDSARDGDPEIYAMAPDGTGVVRLTTSKSRDTWPAWSPDGRRILFQSDREDDQEIWSMTADGRSPARLTSSPGPDSEPAWA